MDNLQAISIYSELRKFRTCTGALAVEWFYDNRPDVRKAFADCGGLNGFATVMSVVHTFWSSRGRETSEDLAREDREKSYTIVKY